MGTSSRGFTIIETMLFLAISGLLILAMVATTGASINIQRYRDAVETFKALIQDQYSALTSVENDRDSKWTCTADASTQADGVELRGQSECRMLGRLMTVSGSDIRLYSVLGRPTSGSDATTRDDVEQLRDEYVLNVSSVVENKQAMEWGTRIAWSDPAAGGPDAKEPRTPRELSILFIRSPSSGQIYTFTSDSVPDEPSPNSLRDMLVATETVPGRKFRTICIDSDGVLVTDDQSIYLNSYATGPSSVESQSNGIIADQTIPRGEHQSRC